MANDLVLSNIDLEYVRDNHMSFYHEFFSNIPFKEFAYAFLTGGNTMQLTIIGVISGFSERSRQRLRRAATFFTLSGLTVEASLIYDLSNDGLLYSVSEIERYAMEQYIGREDYLIRHYFHFTDEDGEPDYKGFRAYWDVCKDILNESRLEYFIKKRDELFLTRNTLLKNEVEFDDDELKEKINEVLVEIECIKDAIFWIKNLRRKYRKLHGIRLRVR